MNQDGAALTVVLPPTDAAVFALIVHRAGGKTTSLLVDCGSQAQQQGATKLVREIFQAHQVTAPDQVVVTSPAAVHTNLLSEIVADGSPRVHHAGDAAQYSGAAKQWLAAKGAKPFPAFHSDLTSPVAVVGDAKVYVVAANASGKPDSADTRTNAAVVLVDGGSERVLLMADASARTAEFLVSRLLAAPGAPAAKALTSPGSLLVYGHADAAAAERWPWAPHAKLADGADHIPLGGNADDLAPVPVTGCHASRVALVNRPLTGSPQNHVGIDYDTRGITLGQV
ncbi:hypothetical protein [Streptomyces sp. XD-27]|uniref:hypothetical protein n=1 Tax=Streptomyces sp. XD-27 TaxID=3062779 RepID=UPI0026F4459C|nr:hypothetical protein [Streptomyces sp. XD-27]WKX74060.1 hypothetical protein Q3Y56_33105 [Streptomyces sp. XD-27]